MQCGDSSWNGAVNVSNQNTNNGFKDNDRASVSGGSRSPAAEEHSVELRFAPTTKRWYKPGLSFKGKVSDFYIYFSSIYVDMFSHINNAFNNKNVNEKSRTSMLL